MKLFKKLEALKDFCYFLIQGTRHFLSAAIGAIPWKPIKEATALTTGILLFFAANVILRWLDPTAATYDAGVLQIINFSVLSFAVYQAITWSVVKNIWPAIGLYFKELFNKDFLNLTPWQRICVSLFIYFSVFAFLVVLSRTIQ